jgi:hypothetical protein
MITTIHFTLNQIDSNFLIQAILPDYIIIFIGIFAYLTE